ncbi:MAG: cytochrome c [Filomicrobium sp.]
MSKIRVFALMVATFVGLGLDAPASAEGGKDAEAEARDYVFGAPETESEAWTLATGGRIYDRWWVALDKEKPKDTHPAYPASGKKSGSSTWRCKECHGWDYRGKDGRYSSGKSATGIIGIVGAKGWETSRIVSLLRAEPHGYTPEMIDAASMERLAAFVSRGQDDISSVYDHTTGKVTGDATRGLAIYQTVCAACHGFDGRELNLGSAEKPKYVGTEANKATDEVLHKIRNGHPGAAMVNLRAFPYEDAAAVLAYVKTLPQK